MFELMGRFKRFKCYQGRFCNDMMVLKHTGGYVTGYDLKTFEIVCVLEDDLWEEEIEEVMLKEMTTCALPAEKKTLKHTWKVRYFNEGEKGFMQEPYKLEVVRMFRTDIMSFPTEKERDVYVDNLKIHAMTRIETLSIDKSDLPSVEKTEEAPTKNIINYDYFFSNHVQLFLLSDKEMSDREIALADINDTFFHSLDIMLKSNISDFELVRLLRQAHIDAVNTIWQTGAIII